ncbi:MAG: Unknown protein [uncultured Sulfurovum sp.]|uniref:Rhodanese domain-containing protein n=1 Tax=uncultured Sulfurovum sp. TaxID=269237 RepID=A0A6S6TZZ6_9BACT|nr:MAG: Unknown protein [uncultured Sulfurovum sp.]
MRYLVLVLFTFIELNAGPYDKVKITPSMSYIYVYHKGKAVKVHRIQDTKYKLTGEYSKLYRPKQYIQAIKIDKNVKTIGEIELLHFMKSKVNENSGIVIDVRTTEKYKRGTIPSSVNIPTNTQYNKRKMDRVFKAIGVTIEDNNTLNVSNAVDVVIFGDGLWSSDAKDMVNTFLQRGFPYEKILYYRGGFQMWKVLGFTTVTDKKGK